MLPLCEGPFQGHTDEKKKPIHGRDSNPQPLNILLNHNHFACYCHLSPATVVVSRRRKDDQVKNFFFGIAVSTENDECDVDVDADDFSLSMME